MKISKDEIIYEVIDRLKNTKEDFKFSNDQMYCILDKYIELINDDVENEYAVLRPNNKKRIIKSTKFRNCAFKLGEAIRDVISAIPDVYSGINAIDTNDTKLRISFLIKAIIKLYQITTITLEGVEADILFAIMHENKKVSIESNTLYDILNREGSVEKESFNKALTALDRLGCIEIKDDKVSLKEIVLPVSI